MADIAAIVNFHNTVLPCCYAPPFAIYFQEKEGGGRNNENLRFRLAVKFVYSHYTMY